MNSLVEYITKALAKPFKWGTHDCCTFAVGWIDIKMGTKELDRYYKAVKAGRSNSTVSAKRLYKEWGGYEKFLDKRFKKINSTFALDGDVTIYQDTAYVFTGYQIVSVGIEGLVHHDRSVVQCAWRIS